MSCFKSILNHAQSVQAKLCNCNLDEGFDFAKNFFVCCFYVNYEGDQENVKKGFLRSTLLVQVYFQIFYFCGQVPDSLLDILTYFHLPVISQGQYLDCPWSGPGLVQPLFVDPGPRPQVLVQQTLDLDLDPRSSPGPVQVQSQTPVLQCNYFFLIICH